MLNRFDGCSAGCPATDRADHFAKAQNQVKHARERVNVAKVVVARAGGRAAERRRNASKAPMHNFKAHLRAWWATLYARNARVGLRRAQREYDEKVDALARNDWSVFFPEHAPKAYSENSSASYGGASAESYKRRAEAEQAKRRAVRREEVGKKIAKAEVDAVLAMDSAVEKRRQASRASLLDVETHYDAWDAKREATEKRAKLGKLQREYDELDD